MAQRLANLEAVVTGMLQVVDNHGKELRRSARELQKALELTKSSTMIPMFSTRKEKWEGGLFSMHLITPDQNISRVGLAEKLQIWGLFF